MKSTREEVRLMTFTTKVFDGGYFYYSSVTGYTLVDVNGFERPRRAIEGPLTYEAEAALARKFFAD